MKTLSISIDSQISKSYLVFKRIFDIVFSLLALILLTPLFVIVAILIKLESSGPVFYSSKRVGQFYQVFDFYKFRSMKVNADALLKNMQHKNQYGSQQNELKTYPLLDEEMEKEGWLVSDGGWVAENEWESYKQEEEKNAFIKIPNDPRITRIGRFIRNTSIDELPQLLNILKGDMSFVGNRPLPLYEAQKLTTDNYIERFNCPAGLTGLWQVTERGKEGVSQESRKLLDIEYSHKCSFLLDMKILIKTPLAALQHENV